MSRVLIVCDRPSWAYDAIAQALIKSNTDPALDLDIFYLKGNRRALRRRWQAYDRVFAMGWQLLATFEDGRLEEYLPFLNPERTITGIHSHHAWDNRQTQPDRSVPPPDDLVEFLARFSGVNVVSRRLYELFRAAGLDNLTYTPNGVDISLFRPTAEIATTGPLRVGFSGSGKHDWRKGVSEYIEPACALPGVELKLAMPVEGRYVPQEEMPGFYNGIDIYLCASSSEGFSLSVLEASACGRPIISTRVGGNEDLIEDGVNGFLVDRDVTALRERVQFFLEYRDAAREMGRANRRIVEERWSWERRAPAWLDFIQGHL